MSGAVHAQISYILPTDEKPVTYLTNPGSKPAQRNAEYREVEVTIRDARPKANALDLEREGFTFSTEEARSRISTTTTRSRRSTALRWSVW